MSLYNKEEIKKFLPHRKPFLFLDSVNTIDYPEKRVPEIEDEKFNAKEFIGTKVTGSFFVDPSLEILKGHFPGNPILPGVVQIEIMAQMCPFLFHYSNKNLMDKLKINVALLGIDKARFKKPIYPNMTLEMKSVLKKVRGIFQTYECEIFGNDHLMSSAEIFASLEFIKKDN